MTPRIVVAGAGIGGLATALALARDGCAVTVLEQTPAFAEVGAGIQLGPNAVRLLDGWGFGPALRAVAAMPQQLQVRDAHDGHTLGTLRLGAACRQRYGHDYLSAHRADLHHLLLGAAQAAGVAVETGFTIKNIAESPNSALASGTNCLKNEETRAGEALIGCDGLWSQVRTLLLGDGPPRATGHLAYRALLPAAAAPQGVATQDVTVWLGPRMHVVCYPVRGGSGLNVVIVVQGQVAGDGSSQREWTHAADAQALLAALPGVHTSVQGLVRAAPGWTRWVLHDRPPLRSPAALARGRVALVGDAAHPMRPYLAQGAAMALEDAAALAQALRDMPHDVPQALQHYAVARWQRNARVQQKSRRNGLVFHARGPVRLARDLAMRLTGERLLDSPWLYAGDPRLTGEPVYQPKQ